MDSRSGEPVFSGYGAGIVTAGNHRIGNEDVAARHHRDWCETCDFTGARNAFLGSAGIAFSRLTVGRCVGASVAIMLGLGAVSSECDLQGWRQYSIDGVVNRGATLRCPVQSDAIVTLHGLVCRDSKVSRTDVSCTDK